MVPETVKIVAADYVKTNGSLPAYSETKTVTTITLKIMSSRQNMTFISSTVCHRQAIKIERFQSKTLRLHEDNSAHY